MIRKSCGPLDVGKPDSQIGADASPRCQLVKDHDAVIFKCLVPFRAGLTSTPEVARAMQIIDLRNQRSDDKTARNRKAREARKALRNGFRLGIVKQMENGCAGIWL